MSGKKLEKEKKASYSKTIDDGKTRESIDVREIDNGYIVSYRKVKTDNWTTLEEKEYYSETNPIEEKSKEDNINEMLSALDKLGVSPRSVSANKIK